MTEHNLKFLGTIILTSLLVGSYQLPLIENHFVSKIYISTP